jgi:hypothetical protein
MKAKQWLLIGFGCIAGSILLGIIAMVAWMIYVLSLHGPPENMVLIGGIVMAVLGLLVLLFIGGVILVVVGFIFLAKEPRPTRARERDEF